MKRQIKFRGKTTANGHWVYGSLIAYEDDTFAIRNSKSQPWVQSGTVGQYTGFDDIAGREIYDGDFCTTRNGDAGLVCWMCNGWFLDCEPTHPTRDKFCIDEVSNLQIIGNIYDDGMKPLQFNEE